MSDEVRGEEKRQHPRYEVEGLDGRLRYNTDARVLNLSVDGMALETPAWLHVGKEYRLKLGSGEELLDLEGTVVWCHLVGNRTRRDGSTGPLYQAGVRFGETLSDQARRILNFVRRAGVVGVASRVFGRFKVRREEAVDVAFEHPFEIVRISLSGMLLEADLLPDVGAHFSLEVETPAGVLNPVVVVRYVEPALNPAGEPTQSIGVEFHRLTDEDRKLLKRLIDDQIAASEPPLED